MKISAKFWSIVILSSIVSIDDSRAGVTTISHVDVYFGQDHYRDWDADDSSGSYVSSSALVPSWYSPDIYGTAFAYGDLSTGKQGVSTSLLTNGVVKSAHAISEVSDTINFHITGANTDTLTTINLAYRIHGEVAKAVGVPAYSNNLLADIRLGSGVIHSRLSENQDGIVGDHSIASGFKNLSVSTLGDTDYLLTFTYELIGANPTVGFGVHLRVSNYWGGNWNFANTGTFSWILPENVTYTSSSGMFLLDVPNVSPPPVGGVPEPATWAMMILGLGLVGCAARARRSRRPSFAKEEHA